MSKKEKYEQDLTQMFKEFSKKGDDRKIRQYLISNSNLPGPRGNLELAEAFAQTAAEYSVENSEEIWKLCQKLVALSADEAPVNNPREFLTFCGTVATGAIGSLSSKFFEKALTCLHELASDSRWRVREGVAMGLQKLLAKKSQKTLNEIEGWIEDDKWLAMRAVAAGVAEPSLLKDVQKAKSAFELHKKVFGKILSAKERTSERFKTLRQGLGYSLSVVVCAIPKEGFEYMRQLAGSQDADVLWIVKENLKKNRLVKNFSDEVDEIKKLL